MRIRKQQNHIFQNFEREPHIVACRAFFKLKALGDACVHPAQKQTKRNHMIFGRLVRYIYIVTKSYITES